MSRTVSVVLIGELSEKWWNSVTSHFNFICRKCSRTFTQRADLQLHKLTHLREKYNVYLENARINSRSNFETIKPVRYNLRTSRIKNEVQEAKLPPPVSSRNKTKGRIAARFRSRTMKSISAPQGNNPANNPDQNWSPKILLREQRIFNKSATSRFPREVNICQNYERQKHGQPSFDGEENTLESSQAFCKRQENISLLKVNNYSKHRRDLLSQKARCLKSDLKNLEDISSSSFKTEDEESSDCSDTVLYLLQQSPCTGDVEQEPVTLGIQRDHFTDIDDSFELVLIEHEEVELVDVDILSECNQEALVLQVAKHATDHPTPAAAPYVLENEVLIPTPSVNKIATVCGNDLDLGATETVELEAEDQGKNMRKSVEARKRNEANMLLRSVLDKTLLIRLRKCDDYSHRPRNRSCQDGFSKLKQSINPTREVEPQGNTILSNKAVTPEVVQGVKSKYQERDANLKRERNISAASEEWSVVSGIQHNSEEPFKIKIIRRGTSFSENYNQKLVGEPEEDRNLGLGLVSPENKFSEPSSIFRNNVSSVTCDLPSDCLDILNDSDSPKPVRIEKILIENVKVDESSLKLKLSLPNGTNDVDSHLRSSKPTSIQPVTLNYFQPTRDLSLNVDETQPKSQFPEALEELCKSLDAYAKSCMAVGHNNVPSTKFEPHTQNNSQSIMKSNKTNKPEVIGDTMDHSNKILLKSPTESQKYAMVEKKIIESNQTIKQQHVSDIEDNSSAKLIEAETPKPKPKYRIPKLNSLNLKGSADNPNQNESIELKNGLKIPKENPSNARHEFNPLENILDKKVSIQDYSPNKLTNLPNEQVQVGQSKFSETNPIPAIENSKPKSQNIPDKKTDRNSEYQCNKCSQQFENARRLRHHEKTHSSWSKRKYVMDSEFIDIDCGVLHEIERMDTIRNKVSSSYSKRNTKSPSKNATPENEVTPKKDGHHSLLNSHSNETLTRINPLNELEIKPLDEASSNSKDLPTKLSHSSLGKKRKLDEDFVDGMKMENSSLEKRHRMENSYSMDRVHLDHSNGLQFFEGFCKICGVLCDFKTSTTHYLNKDVSQPYSCLTCEGKFSESEWSHHNLDCFEEEEFVTEYRVVRNSEGVVVKNEAVWGCKKKRDFICGQCFIVMSGPCS